MPESRIWSMRFSGTALSLQYKPMHTLKHIASVAYTIQNDGLQDLVGKNAYLFKGVLAYEVRLALRVRNSKEPNWFTPLAEYHSFELEQVVLDALDYWTPASQTPEDVLNRILVHLADEVDSLRRNGRDEVLAFVRKSDPTASPFEPELLPF